MSLPVFGCSINGGIFPAGPPTMVSVVGSMRAAKGYNQSTQTQWPGGQSGGIPSGVTYPFIATKLSLTTSSPWLSTTDQSNLASFFASMPSTGRPIATINQEGEAGRFGYTAAQVAGSHNTAYNIFKKHAPANAIYCQNFETYSASSGGLGTNFSKYICCLANGHQDLPLYMLDWYPTSNSTTAVNSIAPSVKAITGVVTNAILGVAECNYTTGSGITSTVETQTAWFTNCWSYAQSHNFLTLITYFYNPHNVNWPPAGGTATENELKLINTQSKGANTVTVTNPGNQTSTAGTADSLQIQATDSGVGQTFTYTATGLPAGMTISSTSGLISGTPTTATTYSTAVTATDTTGSAGSASFTWTVKAPITNVVTVTNPGSQTGTVGTTTSLQITAADSANGQTLTYTASGLPAGLAINSSTGLISGTPTTAQTVSTQVTATDTTSSSGSTTFTWAIGTVQPPPPPPPTGSVYLIGSASSTNSSSTLTIPVTATSISGDAITVGACINSTSVTVLSCTDTQNNTYVRVISKNAVFDSAMFLSTSGPGGFSPTVALLAGGDTVTITYSAVSANPVNGIVAGCPGVLQGTAADQAVSTTSTGSTSPSITTGTLTVPNELIVAFETNSNSGGAITWASQISPVTSVSAATFQVSSMGAQQVTGNASPVNMNGTVSSSVKWNIIAISLYQSAVPPPPPPPQVASPPLLPIPAAGWGPSPQTMQFWVTQPLQFQTSGVLFRAQQSIQQTLTTGGTPYVLNFDNVLEDPLQGWDPVNLLWMVPYTGWYEISVSAGITAAAANIQVAITVTNTSTVVGSQASMSSSFPGGGSAFTRVALIGGIDYVQGVIQASANDNHTDVTTFGKRSTMEIFFISQ